MEVTAQVKTLTLKSFLVVIVFFVLLWLSIFSYALLYYLYIPAIAHVKPVYFRYDSLCKKQELCYFPHDNITLIEGDRFEILSAGQSYAVEVVLHMPESERNLNQGMFMIHLDMISKSGEILKSVRRPAVLHYRSPLFKILYTLFFIPVLLLGSLEEKQSLTVPLFEQYVEDAYKPTYFAFLELEAEFAEVYSCSLNIHAQFTGLRYMMYYWPVLSAVFGIAMNFATTSSIVILIWIRQIIQTPQVITMSHLDEQEQGLIHDIRQAMHKRRERARERTSPGTFSIPSGSGGSGLSREDIEEISPYPVPKSTRWYREKSASKLSAGPSRKTIVESQSDNDNNSDGEASEEVEVISSAIQRPSSPLPFLIPSSSARKRISVVTEDE